MHTHRIVLDRHRNKILHIKKKKIGEAGVGYRIQSFLVQILMQVMKGEFLRQLEKADFSSLSC